MVWHRGTGNENNLSQYSSNRLHDIHLSPRRVLRIAAHFIVSPLISFLLHVKIFAFEKILPPGVELLKVSTSEYPDQKKFEDYLEPPKPDDLCIHG